MRLKKVIAILLAFIAAPVHANVIYVVTGVNEDMRDNVLQYVDTLQFGPQVRLGPADLERIQAEAIDKAAVAIRPFGYYAPVITTHVTNAESASPTVEIRINRGPPVIIETADINIAGAGENEAVLRAWLADWTLQPGTILNQAHWEAQKREALDIAATRGYLGADFTVHAIELDLERNVANLQLTLDTGTRYVMGDVNFGDHMLRPGILEYVPRFEKGDPYTARLVGWLRTDLWKTGYFTDVNVVEVERPDLSPPAVDVRGTTATEHRNRYQGALGWGTDTELRLQANWSRHPLSPAGGRLDIGAGWQQLDDELRLRATHRRPRPQRAREYWVTDLTFSFENQDLEVKRTPEDEDYIQIANGDVTDRHLRFGRLKLTNLESGEHQLFGTLFAQYVNTNRLFRLITSPNLMTPPELQGELQTDVGALSFGYEWDLVAVEGKFFQTKGHRNRAWIFHSNEAWGSDVGFTQAYASTRRSYLLGDRLKFHVRAEVGYTDAKVDELELVSGGTALNLSVTELPNFYRFKAGGSMSVRGYGFEQLSNNDIGSNHIITGSAEMEYRFLNAWSAALFADIGNAFNDWSNPDLKRGVGFGVRWYSIAGEIRVDYAKALDFDGDPWRLHITIGTPLL